MRNVNPPAPSSRPPVPPPPPGNGPTERTLTALMHLYEVVTLYCRVPDRRYAAVAEAAAAIDEAVGRAKDAASAEDTQHLLCACGTRMVKNPHPDAGLPLGGVGYVWECVPCRCRSITEWAKRAHKAEAALRDLGATPTAPQQVLAWLMEPNHLSHARLKPDLTFNKPVERDDWTLTPLVAATLTPAAPQTPATQPTEGPTP